MKTVPLIVTDTVNNSYQCYKVMADEDMTEVDVIAAIKKVITEFCETEAGKVSSTEKTAIRLRMRLGIKISKSIRG